jgi:hypothetical protein
MQESMQIRAVECIVCKKLHKIAGSFLRINGSIKNKDIILANNITEERPLILCDIGCLERFIENGGCEHYGP